ncbi:putative transmembrane protein [Rhizoctonia solani 123E]|uniref:Putative transmembrane protein n=1 Tax=Rhizoctonia solani 123E TaxID=1423351 RepID=A0A074RKP9_9AGAM|nr:putative transmembrane protein [Rhizoctonia solani 123E]
MTGRSIWMIWLGFLGLVFVSGVNADLIGNSKDIMNFCKCICFSNYTILPIYHPTTDKPCLSCTKQWCLDQKLDICAGAKLGDSNPDTATGKEGDVEARCFQRDSPRDQLVVTLFLLIVFGLLLGAAVKGRMEKAGFDSATLWSRRRNWYEAFVPSRMPDTLPLGSNNHRREHYEPVSNTPPAERV